MDKYRVRVLNNKNKIIFDEEIHGLAKATNKAKSVEGAINIGITHVGRTLAPGYYWHKFIGEWKMITEHRFEEMERRGN